MSLLSRLFPPKPAALLCPHCEREMSEGHDVDACARKRMSRRFFFGVMGGAAVAVAVAPQIESFGDWTVQIETGPMFYGGNELLTVEQITADMLRVLRDSVAQIPQINRKWGWIFADAESKIDDTLTIRKPHQLLGQDRSLWQG
jgi:hypothetical protein